MRINILRTYMHFLLLKKLSFAGLVFVLLLLSQANVMAQKIDPNSVSNEQAVDFYKKAKASGMSDMDIEQAALQRGYTLDQITAMRKRLQEAQSPAIPATTGKTVLDDTRKNNDESAISHKEAGVKKDNLSGNIFGASFYSNPGNTF